MSQNTEESVKTTSDNTTESLTPRTIEAVEDTEQEIQSGIADDQTDGDNSLEMPEWWPREMLSINHEVCQSVHCGAGAVEYDTSRNGRGLSGLSAPIRPRLKSLE